MKKHTLVFDTDLQDEDIDRFANCTGVLEVSAHGNVIHLHYMEHIRYAEIISVASEIIRQEELGAALVTEDMIISSELCEMRYGQQL